MMRAYPLMIQLDSGAGGSGTSAGEPVSEQAGQVIIDGQADDNAAQRQP